MNSIYVLTKLTCSLHLVRIQDNQKISNLTDERRNILRFFPKPCQEYYLLS
ncbi:unknown protein [Microcystis aeruginosa NIES-843]|uniref:Uncharacterized protein n=1 Tax=Microcystis aeruginosa (strain NIES-843 / IAM M-2473) TaxID=449447 RepID=B0JJ44_MICAN|nr:unknown protein [Microcystis aeruginosa NIES-843]